MYLYASPLPSACLHRPVYPGMGAQIDAGGAISEAGLQPPCNAPDAMIGARWREADAGDGVDQRGSRSIAPVEPEGRVCIG